MVSLDDPVDGADAPAAAAAAPEPVAEEAAAAAPAADGADDDELDFTKMKKKSKKNKDKKEMKPMADEAPAAAAPAPAPAPVVYDALAPLETFGMLSGVDFDALTTDFVFPEKKKRKRTKVVEEYAVEVEDASEAGPAVVVDTAPWAGTDRDYTYTELLERVFNIIHDKNPGMKAGEKRRFVMKPPQVIRLGSKKSGFVNFMEICKLMHRAHDHVLNYIFTELGTSGQLDGTKTLVLKGRYQQKQMESVLRRYIREYVTCHTCKSPDTILSRENRLFFMTCETCGARQSVATVKAGFSAVVGKRSRIRAAQGN